MHHDAPIPAPALWGKTTAQQVVESMPPPDCSMCDPDFLAVAPARRWFDPVLDFGAALVLGVAMSLMEEREPGPPPMPWRDLGLMAAVVVVALLSAHFWAAP